MDSTYHDSEKPADAKQKAGWKVPLTSVLVSIVANISIMQLKTKRAVIEVPRIDCDRSTAMSYGGSDILIFQNLKSFQGKHGLPCCTFGTILNLAFSIV